ncbi:MAG TPA: glycogen-binding domain-containing protein [Acidobacteriota bacterium]|nr:glycogen-binding domain-containing protein [Acidobacteriota bacterium]
MDDKRNKKIHSYLDDELQRREFTADELRDVEIYEDIINETRNLYKSVEAPDLSAVIMRRLKADAHKNGEAQSLQDRPGDGSSRSPFFRVAAWLWAVRPVSLRPIYVIAAVAIVMAILLIGGTAPFQDPAKPEEVPAVSKIIFVQFRLEAPQASVVQLAGSFSDWQPAYTLHQSAPGVWSALIPLAFGVHDYAFLVNDTWILDPLAPAVSDGFGGAKSRILILMPNGGSHI